MPVPMMGIGHVGVAVHQGRMLVPVRVRFARRITRSVRVLVVLVVGVQVLVFQRFVTMLMLVTLGQVQPNAEAHEHCGENEAHRELVA